MSQIKCIVTVAILIIFFQGCRSQENEDLKRIVLPCQGTRELNDFLNRIESETKLVFKVCPKENFSISADVSISSINRLYIIGNNSIIKCDNNIALSFTNVTNLYMENVQLLNCGNHKQNGGLHIVNSTNLTLKGVIIDSSLKTGLVLRNIRGEVIIENSNFINNDRYWKSEPEPARRLLSSSDNDFHARGGGMQLILGDKQAYSSISIRNCEFLRNFGSYGGGLFLVVHERAKANNVAITDSVFEHNRCHYGGGGMQIGYVHDEDENETTNGMQNLIYIGNSNFSHNEATYGGGTAVFATFGSLQFSYNSLIFDACNWTNNSAILGLAMDVSVSPWETISSLQHLPSLIFNNCNFSDNKDLAVINSPFIMNKIRGTLVVTRFKLGFKNQIVFESNLGSAIEATAAILDFDSYSNVRFVGNRGEEGAALNLKATSVVNIRDNSQFLFEGNKATYSGGAIYSEISDKHSLFNQQNCFMKYVGGQEPINVSLIFRNNTAAADKSSPPQLKNDSIRYRGDSIYATSLLSCFNNCLQQLNLSTANKILSFTDALKCIGTFTLDYQEENSTSTGRQMSSAPHHFALKESDTDSSRYHNDSMCQVFVNTTSSTIHRNPHYQPIAYNPLSGRHFLIPGKPTRIPLRLVDDFCSELFFLVQVRVVSSEMDSLFIHPAHSVITDNYITLYGNENDSGQVQLTTPGIRSITVTINVTMDQCPPGYVHRPYKNSKLMACQCSSDDIKTTYRGIQRCNETEFRAYSQHGYWVGYNETETRDESTLATALCPIGFCTNFTRSEREHPLPLGISEDISIHICNSNRTGFVCGKCRENHSAFYHSMSFVCGSNDLCYLGSLFYILSEIIPVTILFLIVIFFNISFTSGPLNGVIFFIQVIDSLKIKAENFIWFEPPLRAMNQIRQIFFRMFSLNFFSHSKMSFCLIKNASAMDMLAFKYVTIIYSLFLVIGTILLLKICTFKLCRKSLNIKGSIIHGLSAFLVMSYSECTRVSLMILTMARVTAGPGSENITKVAFYNGNYVYLGADHLQYALPAIFFLMTMVSIPPLLLLSYPLCYKLFALLRIEESKLVQITCKVIPLEKIKPLFDSMQGAFKDRYRFFAGLYFLYRLLSLLSFSTAITLTDHYTLSGALLVFILAAHAAFRPYKNMWHNILDACLFCNLFAINTITQYNYNLTFDKSRDPEKIQFVMISIQLVLIMLPLIYLIFYTVYSIVMRLKPVCSPMCLRYSKNSSPEDTSDLILQTLDEREIESSTESIDCKHDSSQTDYSLIEESQGNTYDVIKRL